MSAGRGVGVLIFPGTNSEEETLRACLAAGLPAELVPWNAPLDDVRAYEGYVLPGGFAYEDRVRAGAIAAHDRLMGAVREGAAAGKPVLGICNGAQILLESGLAPELDGRCARRRASRETRRSGSIARRTCTSSSRLRPNGPRSRRRFRATSCCRRGRRTAKGGWPRLRTYSPASRRRIASRSSTAMRGAMRRRKACRTGPALGAAALVNGRGNVLAIMPHPERAAWTYMQHGSERERARGDAAAMLATSGGIALFAGLASAVARRAGT